MAGVASSAVAVCRNESCSAGQMLSGLDALQHCVAGAPNITAGRKPR
jgi:hypothetical protein